MPALTGTCWLYVWGQVLDFFVPFFFYLKMGVAIVLQEGSQDLEPTEGWEQGPAR